MLDENMSQTNDVTSGATTPETTETQMQEEYSPQTPEEKRSLFSAVWNRMFNSKKEEEVGGDDTEPTNTTSEGAKTEGSSKETQATTGESGVLIEADIYEAAKASGLSDDEIVSLFKTNGDALKKLIPVTKKSETPQEEQKAVALEQLKLSDDDISQLKDQYGEEVIDKVVQPLIAKLNQTIDIVNQQANLSKVVEKNLSRQNATERFNDFNNKLDKLAESYEMFGKWENVPQADGKIAMDNPTIKVRKEVWNKACQLQAAGVNWDTAVDDAVAWYKGKHLEQVAEAKLIKKLQEKKQQFTARPMSRKVAPEKLSGEQAKIALIKEGLKLIGKE